MRPGSHYRLKCQRLNCLTCSKTHNYSKNLLCLEEKKSLLWNRKWLLRKCRPNTQSFKTNKPRYKQNFRKEKNRITKYLTDLHSGEGHWVSQSWVSTRHGIWNKEKSRPVSLPITRQSTKQHPSPRALFCSLHFLIRYKIHYYKIKTQKQWIVPANMAYIFTCWKP